MILIELFCGHLSAAPESAALAATNFSECLLSQKDEKKKYYASSASRTAVTTV